MMPEHSIVICTHNRVDNLIGTLDAALSQTLDANRYEIIVVDNGSTDATLQVVRRYVDKGRVLAIQESRLGLNYARNTGWKNAKGRYVTFLDDDAIPQEDCFERIVDCLERVPEIGVLGGAVIPGWSQPVPEWLAQELYPALSICNYSGPPGGFPLNFPQQYPVGANITYAKEALLRLGGFNPSFDRRGGLLLSGGETEFNFRCQAAGWPIWFCPTAVVVHQISPDRLQPSFFRTRYYWSGRTWALLNASLFGYGRLGRELLRRLVLGLTLDLARYLYFGFVKRRNPLLTEVYYRELMGYIYQTIQIIQHQRLPYHY